MKKYIVLCLFFFAFSALAADFTLNVSAKGNGYDLTWDAFTLENTWVPPTTIYQSTDYDVVLDNAVVKQTKMTKVRINGVPVGSSFRVDAYDTVLFQFKVFDMSCGCYIQTEYTSRVKVGESQVVVAN